MKRKRLQMNTNFVMSDSADLQPAVRGFAGLLNPELTAAVRKTRSILLAVNKDEPIAVVDPAELRRQELREQMASLQAELATLEGLK